MQATRMIKRALDTAEQAGAVAGGFLPGASLAQYLTHDLPRFRRVVQEAPEFESLTELAKVLRAGDIGLGGNYAAEDRMLQLLNSGSAHMSGSGLSHGQVVGPAANRFLDEQGVPWHSSQLSRSQRRQYPTTKARTVFHGGSHSAVDAVDAFNAWSAGLPNAIREGHLAGVRNAGDASGLLAKAKGYASGLLSSPRLFSDFNKKQNAARLAAAGLRGKPRLFNLAATVADDAVSHADRPYLYLRDAAGPLERPGGRYKALLQLLNRESAAVYDAPGAIAAGLKSLLLPRGPGVGPAVRTFNQELARTGGNVAKAVKGIQCDAAGHHCGSLVHTVLQRLNLADRRAPAKFALPSLAALNDNLRPVGVVHKAKMLQGLNRSALARTGLGLAATAAGAAGGATLASKLINGPQTIRSHVQQMFNRKFGR